MSEAATFGRGIGFAVGLSTAGEVRFSAGPANIAEALELILATDPGERLMLPTFGAGLRRFLFEPNTAATHRLIEERVTRAVERWEPRVRLESVEVAAHRTEAGVASVVVRYRLVATAASGDVVVAVPVDQAGAGNGG